MTRLFALIGGLFVGAGLGWMMRGQSLFENALAFVFVIVLWNLIAYLLRSLVK